MGVGVPRQHLVPDEVLDKGQGPARGGVVGVRHAARPVRPGHHLVVPDDGLADPGQQRALDRLTRAHAWRVCRVVTDGRAKDGSRCGIPMGVYWSGSTDAFTLSLIHISDPTRRTPIS